ncbi:aconitate hydratase [Dethiosulfovibrio sp. F2B]|uniref:aconitate hydratase n=1 Tax=Dethiosulfovibrio faecalis TaxID=2720018 RepID=UPI001F2CB867|nr:aconitate hydratase [Dethiosulfovibrio faecalis]MCF4150795.1 aconitate hydratase [Dethiosulfovibrio faecalis]
MGMSIAQKIVKAHLVEGDMTPGERVGIRIDHTLTQDATGTMAYLEFEAMGVDKVRTELSISYVDHNMIQGDFRNPDDHRYLQDVAAKHGIIFSPPGNGICHQLNVERFARPGKTLLGSDSHTPTSSGVGMLAIGAGGLDVAMAMAGEPFYTPMPRILGVRLMGKLQPFVSAKDVVLEVLRHTGVKGGVGKVIEYFGPGVESLSVPDRATITNMGAETGATSSLFPSDDATRRWLRAQGREAEWIELKPDEDVVYDEVIDINLSELEPMIAQPFQPGNVVKVSEIEGMKIDQVMFGSCTNSSLRDLMAIGHLLDGQKVSSFVDAGISPGSRQVFMEATDRRSIGKMISAGVRILEVSCGACIGMGFAPNTDGVSLRTINRNFLGRCGHKSGKVYLVSPEVAAVSAVTGVLTDPRKFADKVGIDPFHFELPENLVIDDSRFIAPSIEPEKIEIRRGPNIKPLPDMAPMGDVTEGEVLLKTGDDITTDHIMPAGAKILPLRSNIPEISKHVFEVLDETFPQRSLDAGGGFILGGSNYGQGSSREHAAIAPRYLGIRAVIVKSFARIHLANLVNFGILPLTFVKEGDYDRIDQGDRLSIDTKNLKAGDTFLLKDETKGIEIPCVTPVDQDDLDIIKSGSKLNFVKDRSPERA